MIIDKDTALGVLLEEADTAAEGNINPEWEARIEEFSQICESTSKTHIAFLGTALLAKTVRLDVDVFAVKARSEEPGAYSARGLGHGVLVPHAPELGINLGVSGREPLNNQPYFRIMKVAKDIPIHNNARPAINALCDLLDILQEVDTVAEARQALRAFIYVRRKYSPTYGKLVEVGEGLTPEAFAGLIETFVAEASEGGKRAQAVTAGLMDLFAGSEHVETGRVNDPDRHIPGDVGVRMRETPDQWEKVLEVRDKPVSAQDLYLFAQKAVEAEGREAVVVAVATNQPDVPVEEVRQWAAERGVALSVFFGWQSFVRQVLFWCEAPQFEAVKVAPRLIHERLVELEVSEKGAANWIASVSESQG